MKDKIDVFIKIQKAAGTSLINYIASNGQGDIEMLDHAYCYKLKNKNTGWMWSKENFPTFDKYVFNNIYALVRNPFDILVSYYFHLSPNFTRSVSAWDFLGNDGWNHCNIIHGFKTWREFLDAYIDPNFEWHLPPMKKSMFSFIYDEDNNLIIDRYFKVENINELKTFFYQRGWKEPCVLPKTNSTTLRPLGKLDFFYKPEDVKQLEKIWEKDLNYFNYSFY